MYGPDGIEEEAYYMVGVIQGRIKCVTRRMGGSIGCNAHMQVRKDADGEWYYVLALIDTQEAMTATQLHSHMLHECRERHVNFIRNSCAYEMLGAEAYNHICTDYNAYVLPQSRAI
jgi:hypothetical protein